MTTDLVGMMRAVEAMSVVVDWGTVLIAADAAADANDLELEAGLRWCARNKKWPRSYTINTFGRTHGWAWDSSRKSGRTHLPQNIDRWLGPGGYHDPDLAELLRRTGRGLFALEIV